MTTQLCQGQLHYTRAKTLGEMLRERAEGPQGPDVRLLFVREEEVPEGRALEGDDERLVYSYAEVFETARRAARALERHGVRPGDRVLLVLPTGPSFLAAYHGCQILGAVAVPVVPPLSLARLDDHIARIARIARICDARATVVASQLLPVFRLARSRHRDARAALSSLLLGTELLAEGEALCEVHPARPEDPAMIQFTSGSTGDPKGVVLPHASLLANMKGIGLGAGFRPGDCAVSWLPLFHDMGLIGHFLASMAWGLPLVLLPPEKFIRRPKEWLRAISNYKGTCSAAPNFAYSLCTKKIRDRDLEGVDLSSWRVAFCGAEPINANTVERFIERFEPFGFSRGTFYPVYGMAEFSLAATFPPPGRGPRYDRVDRAHFERTGEARRLDGDPRDDAESITWISVGSPLPGGHEVRIVDASGEPLGERREGEIEVRGPSLMAGYYEAPLATAEALRDGWLRTGDRGYLADGELYVTGRTKEIIIKGGKNIYPQDVEAAAASVEGVRVGCCAAFGLGNAKRGTEDLVLVCETRVEDPERRADMIARIRSAVLEATSATPDAIVLVEPHTVPKTSSGKIQRDLMRKRYTSGDLRPGRPSLFTLLRLRLSATLQRVREVGLAPLRKARLG
ncbi:MAG: fatty acyl-AMP ligase [Planctomycetota bacterium]|nr:MAG: fatty acyl-AMP ligase [Planctomycetota bacterium]